MSLSQLKEWLELVAAVLALPAALFGLYLLARYWRGKVRKEAGEGLAREKEIAYLAALDRHMQELNRPLRYQEGEFTPGEGRLVEQEQVAMRYVFRRSTSADEAGLTPGEILDSDRTKAVHNVVDLLRKSHHPVVLLGDPGSGKSVTLRQLAQTLAREPGFTRALPVLPVYLHLGRYRQVGKGGRPVDFLAFIKEELKNFVPLGEYVLAALDDALAQGRVFLLLDAMDEMPTRQFSERVDAIKNFLIEYGARNRVIIACRRREYAGGLPHSELIIEPFSPERIRQYLERHWALYADRLGALVEEPQVRKRYFDIARPGHPLFAFATNPFSLKLIANHFFANKGTVPRAHSELFESYVSRRLAVAAARQQLPQARQELILRHWEALAFAVLRGSLGTYLKRPPDGTVAVAGAREQELEAAISAGVQSGLLREERDGAVRFEHHRLLEYLAAKFWDGDDEHLTISAEHLRNPWWRETLVMRAGITKRPDALVRGVVLAIDRGYTSALGLRFSGEGAPASDSPDDSVEMRLNGIVAIEVALACARQRVTELATDTFDGWLRPLADAVAQQGTLIEQVRLARSLQGFPLWFSHHALAMLAQVDSDWLAREVFSAIERKDYRDPHFGDILIHFVKSTRSTLIVSRRLYAARTLSLVACLKAAPREARGALLWAMAREVAFLGGICVISGMVGLYIFSMGSEQHTLVLVGLALVLLVFSLLFSGIPLTLFLVMVSAGLFWMLPPRTAGRLSLLVLGYHWGIGTEFQRFKWISNPVRRYFGSVLAVPRWFRCVLWFMGFNSLYIFLWAQLRPGPVPWWQSLPAAVVSGLVTESLLTWVQRRRTLALVHGEEPAADEQARRAHVDACLARLHRPVLPHEGQRILEHVVKLPFAEAELIGKLKELAASEEFTVPRDQILQAIDRIDLRRRQKTLEQATA